MILVFPRAVKERKKSEIGWKDVPKQSGQINAIFNENSAIKRSSNNVTKISCSFPNSAIMKIIGDYEIYMSVL